MEIYLFNFVVVAKAKVSSFATFYKHHRL